MTHCKPCVRAVPALLTALCLLAASSTLPGCAGGGTDGGGGGGSSPDSSVPVVSNDKGPREPGTARSFDARTLAFMKDGLHQFSAGDPAWEQTRAKWLAMGPRESDFLVHTMFAGLLKAQQGAHPHLVEQARAELIRIGRPGVEMLGDLIAGGDLYRVYDQQAEQEKTVAVDDNARREAARIMTGIGAPAAPKLVETLQNAETKSGRRFGLQALGDMGEASGDLGKRTLIQYARDPDWVVRVAAVHGLRTHHDDATRQALIAALADEESLVREKATDGILERVEATAAPALRAASERAKVAGRIVEAGRMARAAQLLEQGPR